MPDEFGLATCTSPLYSGLMRSAQHCGAASFFCFEKVGVIAKAQRAQINADRALLRRLMLLDGPGMQLRQHGRVIGLRQSFFGGLQMRIAGAAPPDIALGIGRFGLHLGIGLAGTLARHGDSDAGRLLELIDHELAPFLLDRTIDGEVAVGAGRTGTAMRASAKRCEKWLWLIVS